MNKDTLCAAILLADEPSLALVCGRDSGDLRFSSGEVLIDEGWGGFMGFHDWMRGVEPDILGVRWWPADAHYLDNECFSSKPYITRCTDPALTIWFSADRAVDESRSDDQSMTYNRLLVSRQGVGALILDLAGVPKAEIEKLRTRLPPREATWLDRAP